MKNSRDVIKSEFKYYLANVARSARRTSDGFNLGRTAVDSFLSFLEVERLFDYNPGKWSHIESMYDITNPKEVKQIADILFNDPDFTKHDNAKNQGWRSGAISHYVCFINARSFFGSRQEYQAETAITQSILQQVIFYGAPGTGKSNAIKNSTEQAEKEGRVFRTTFHPDSDYSTFVGCYKPGMKSADRIYSAEELAVKLKEIKNSGVTYPCHKFAAQYWRSLKDLSADTIKQILIACGFTETMNVEISKGIAIGQEYLNKDEDGKIIYTFTPQAFTNAYVKAWNTEEDVFLIIEEINRGNCAQIFGDLFQLLDRKNGVSEYPIDADADLANYLSKKLASSTHKDITDEIREGKKLKLPSNLYIWATMNTSDQSLFPIDSAFKRRWDWKYMKIKNHPEENYKIKLSDKEYDWWEFIQRINEIIASMTSSADKQLGYFFCKAAGDGTISPETFVSKVIFYLWNDVFKDYGFEDASLFRYKSDKDEMKDLTFPDFYDEDGEKVNETRLKDFLDKVQNWKKDKEEQNN